MYDLQDLYQEIILDHNRRPRNFRKPEGANCNAEGFNPLCGDQLTLYLTVEDQEITDVGFQGEGCAISKASASMMTESIKGKTDAEAREVFNAFHRMITQGQTEDSDSDVLGDLEILQGVSEYPTRIKCATLAWHALQAALNGAQQGVSTE